MHFSQIYKVTADDGGYSQERDIGIMKSVTNGIVNSVSVLINGSTAKDFALAVKNSICSVNIGLHLNLSEGVPVTSSLSELVDGKGFLLGKNGCWKILNQPNPNLREQVRIVSCKLINTFKNN